MTPARTMNNGNQCTVILIHGAWHTPDCWDAVIARLKQKKFPAIAPLLHQSRHDSHTGHYPGEIQTLLKHIRENDLNQIVLIGHSHAGTIISELAGLIPQHINHLIFLNAFVPVKGKSIMDDLPRFHKKVLFDLAKASGDETILLPYTVWEDTFMNGAEPKLIKKIYRQLIPEHINRFTRPSTTIPVSDINIPKTYIHAEDDIALPQGKWGWVPRMPARLGDHQLVRIAGNHEVLFTAPDIVADAILQSLQTGKLSSSRGQL